MSDKIIQVNAVDEMRKDYVRYSIMANRRRMIPDMRDGLKTVHRRILDCMLRDVKCTTSNTVKSARIIGSVLGLAHPHGDTAAYDSIKTILNEFEVKMPLIIGQGNFGNVSGDKAAAMRYTEATLSPFALEAVLAEMREAPNVVDWCNNFDDTRLEPEFLPVRVPLLLINGAFGIGFGMKSDIPSHNLAEVIDQTIKLIRNPKHKVFLVPDHCCPVEILDTDFKTIGNTGRGKYTARGIIDIEDTGKGSYSLVISSLPDRVFFNTIIEQLEELAIKNILPISDIDNESSTKETRFVVKLKKGVDPQYARDLIFQKTSVSGTYSINFEVLNNKEPIRMSYKSYLESFIEFRKVCKFRLYHNKLQMANTSYHEKEAYIKALESGEIDNIIQMIRKLKDDDETSLIEYLITKLKITDLQAKYIINAGLKKLSIGYLNRLKEECKGLTDQINMYTKLLIDEDALLETIIEELEYFKKKYGSPRISKLVSSNEVSNIAQGNFRVIVTEKNFIKKLPEGSDYGRFKDDKPKFIIDGDNPESILLFDDRGKVFNLPIHHIAMSDKSSNGIDIRLLIKNCTANIVSAIYEPMIKKLAMKPKYFMTVLTNTGLIKKMDLDDFFNIPKSGILYIKLENNDFVRRVSVFRNDIDLVVFDSQRALRMGMNDIPHQRRNTKGMKSMFSGNAEGMSIVKPNADLFLVVTGKGYCNKIAASSLPNLGRNREGANVISLGKGDYIQSIHSISKDDTTLQYTDSDGIDSSVDIQNIAISSTVSKGVKAIKMKKGDVVISTTI